MNNQLEKVTLDKGTSFQVELVNKIDKATQEMGQAFTDYGRQCVINAIANLVTTCKTNDIPFNSIDQTMVKIALQNVGYTELNFAATPAEAYFDLRKSGQGYSISIKPQGAGNEKLTRRFGVNVKELRPAWLVREGDEFEYPQYDGINVTPPKWRPKSFDKKVIMVVYPVILNNGSVEYLIATREGIKPNLIAQIRQNNLYTFKKDKFNVDVEKRDAFYDEVNSTLEDMTVDQILSDPRWIKELTPTYSSGGSREAMVIRKMKNNALKNYPREFSSDIIRQAVSDMYEDRDDSLKKDNVVDVDMVEKVESEITEPPTGEDAIKDFDVNEDGKVAPKQEAKVPEAKSIDSYEEDL